MYLTHNYFGPNKKVVQLETVLLTSSAIVIGPPGTDMVDTLRKQFPDAVYVGGGPIHWVEVCASMNSRNCDKTFILDVFHEGIDLPERNHEYVCKEILSRAQNSWFTGCGETYKFEGRVILPVHNLSQLDKDEILMEFCLPVDYVPD